MNTNKTKLIHTNDSILGEKPISKLPGWRDMMISRITAVARKVNHKLFMLRKRYLSRLINAFMLVAMLLPNAVGTVNAAQIDSNQIKASYIGETSLEIDLSNTDEDSVYQAPKFEHLQAIQHPRNEATIDSPIASEQPKLVSRAKIVH